MTEGNFIILVCYLFLWSAFPKSNSLLDIIPLLVSLPDTKQRQSQLSETYQQACVVTTSRHINKRPSSRRVDISRSVRRHDESATSISFLQASRHVRQHHSEGVRGIGVTHHSPRPPAIYKPLVSLNIACISQFLIRYFNSNSFYYCFLFCNGFARAVDSS